MLRRPFGLTKFPTSNQETAISYGGKTFAIVSAEQLEYMVDQKRQQTMFENMEQRKTITDEELSKVLEDFKENCGYSTLANVLGKMTAQERKEWEHKYRFTPISRTIRG